MADDKNHLNLLLEKLERLSEQQASFSKEIQSLKDEINALKFGKQPDPEPTKKVESPVESKTNTPPPSPVVTAGNKPPSPFSKKANPAPSLAVQPAQAKAISDRKPQAAPIPPNVPKTPKSKSDLEKFIGENLINKIGIVITIIGVAIGAKYSIEHDLISPLTRIVLGYGVGIALLLFGIKLKKKYLNFSAVLISGAMTIMYLLTYAAYSYYDFFGQTIAFGLMALFTIFTVLASLNYNKQVVAHIGLVGAYAVPFLLSDGSGRAEIMFSYMAIINTGILVVSFKKYWKPLLVSSFVFTWIIFSAWFLINYDSSENLALAWTFLTIFFVQFYITFLAYKVIRKELFVATDIFLLFGNAFLFFGIGIDMVDDLEQGDQFLGLFTLANAILHFAVSAGLYKSKLVDQKIVHLIASLVLVFITITFPIQLDGSWVTICWAVQAAIMFWIGRTKSIKIYEKLSYVLMLLAAGSLLQDLTTLLFDRIDTEDLMNPIFNVHFLTSVLFCAAFGFISYINRKTEYATAFISTSGIQRFLNYSIGIILIGAAYWAFHVEITIHFNQLFEISKLRLPSEANEYTSTVENYDLIEFRDVVIVMYGLLFAAALSLLNIYRLKSRNFGILSLFITIFAMLSFLMVGLFKMSELRESYLSQDLAEYYTRDLGHLLIRYVGIAVLIITLIISRKHMLASFMKAKLKTFFEAILHISALWVLSSELIHWLDMAEAANNYKLGLSIFWGVYAVFLVVLGIWKRKQHLRISGMVLFGLTLLKLFFYDIAHLNTLSKTIVFISLGALLLIISFLYNKFNKSIQDDTPA